MSDLFTQWRVGQRVTACAQMGEPAHEVRIPCTVVDVAENSVMVESVPTFVRQQFGLDGRWHSKTTRGEAWLEVAE